MLGEHVFFSAVGKKVLFPNGGFYNEHLISFVEFKDGLVPALGFKRSCFEGVVAREARIGLSKQLTHEVVKIGLVDGPPLELGFGNDLRIVGIADGLNQIYPALAALRSQPLSELLFEKADQALCQVRLVVFGQKPPLHSVFDLQFVSKLLTLGHTVPVRIHQLDVASLFKKFCDAPEPLVSVLTPGGFHKQSVGEVFDCEQESGAAFVVPRPRLVEFSVVNEKDARL